MDFLTQKRSEIDQRLKELKPLYDEYLTLEKAKAALDGVDGVAPRGARTKATTKRGKGRRGRPSGTGGTSAKVLEVIRKNPGIGVRDISKQLRMNHPNYLYRVLPKLEKSGAIKKQGKGWKAA